MVAIVCLQEGIVHEIKNRQTTLTWGRAEWARRLKTE